MAKDDYYTIVAKILVYLYKKYKQKDIEQNYILPMTKNFPIYEEQHRIINRSGVEVENVIDAVKNGTCLKTKTSNGRLSNTYINDNC